MNEIELKIKELTELKSATETALNEMKASMEGQVETKSAIDNLDSSIKELSTKLSAIEKEIEVKESERSLYEQAEKNTRDLYVWHDMDQGEPMSGTRSTLPGWATIASFLLLWPSPCLLPCLPLFVPARNTVWARSAPAPTPACWPPRSNPACRCWC